MENADIQNSQVGVLGDNAHIEGGINYYITRIENGREVRIPWQIPARAEHFINRKAELKQIIDDIISRKAITLCGPGGIGKTALAAEAVWRLDSDKKLPEIFPDGIIFHSFYGRPEAALAFEHIVKSFNEEARDTSYNAALRMLAGKRVLLMLDGTEEADDLRKVLNIRGKCGVIVTSRQKKDAEAEREDIAPLPTDEAVKLLRAWGGDQAENEEAARQVCEMVGGLPLAVRLVGKYLYETGEPASEYLEWLEETPLEALDQGKRKLESVPLLIRRSLEQVSETARQIIGLCGQLALFSFSREMISAAFPEIQIRKPLNELILYSLVQRSGDRFEISHPLIYTYARTELLPDEEIFRRLVNYLNNFTREQSEKGSEGYARLDPERPHILRIIKECAERKEWQKSINLIGEIDSYLDIYGYGTDRVKALKLGIVAAKELNDRRDEGNALGNLGIAYHSLGQVHKAIECFRQALAIHKEIGDRLAIGYDMSNFGLAYYSLGQVDKAIEYYQQALAIHKEIGNRRGEGFGLSNLGIAYSSLGQMDKAIEYYQQALIIHKGIEDRRSEGSILGNIGIVYYSLGQMEQAIEYYEQALTIHKKTGDRRAEGSDLDNLGLAYSFLGQTEKAIEYHEQALTIHKKTEDRRGEGNDLGNLGIAYKKLGQIEKAIECCQQALIISKKTGDRRAEGKDLGNLGSIWYSLGQTTKAIEYHEQALAISRETGDRYGEGSDLGNLGIAWYSLGQTKKARQYMKQSITIFEEIKSPSADRARKQLAELSEQETD